MVQSDVQDLKMNFVKCGEYRKKKEKKKKIYEKDHHSKLKSIQTYL